MDKRDNEKKELQLNQQVTLFTMKKIFKKVINTNFFYKNSI